MLRQLEVRCNMQLKVDQLHSRAETLAARFKRGGESSCIEEAIVLDREALEHRPPGHPERSRSLTWLSIHLSARYNRYGTTSDIDEAIVLGREALDFCPLGHPDRPMSLNNVALYLSTRYKWHGAVQDLDEAIILGRAALHLRPPGHPDRSVSLKNLAGYLSTRYHQQGTIRDLDEAIVLDQGALELRPPGHPDRSSSLNNLANRLFTRYEQQEAIHDLDNAIDLARKALDLRPPGHPDRSMSLNNLALYLSTRYEQRGTTRDLDDAIALGREALHHCPLEHPDRSMSLNNLAVDLSTRYQQHGAIKDLDEAIVLGREALNFCPPGHPDRSSSLDNLAGHLSDRFRQSKQLQDKEEVFRLYVQLVDVTQFVSPADFSAAKSWIGAAENFQHSSLLLAYETSLRLLVQHLATLPSLPEHLVILKNLTSSLAVDAFSACLRHCFPEKAVELLEQGRGVFWSQLTRLRSPLEDVIASGPVGRSLADLFSRLASRIRDALNSPCADQHERVHSLNVEMQNVVTKIRELPGLSHFLLPSLFSDLQCAAKGGPVIVVNASKHGCDALIIFVGRDPVHIPLQITQKRVRDLEMELYTLSKNATRTDMTKQLAFFLRKLWDHIVAPIVDFLRTTLPFQSRIWWCPTAEFSLLPLHAAAPYRRGQRKLADMYISSYTPSLTALIRARRPNQSTLPAELGKHFVAIGQAKAVGERELLSADTELENIGKRIDPLAKFTNVHGEESCVARVAEEICKNEWVHLACHGTPNLSQPFESAFALHDGRFTIQRILGCESKNPEFAYLSACHTTVGDKESPDEVIHLAAAMQFAGFRSVIGTMWAVDDGETNKITSTFYRHMVDELGRLDHTRAAYALNRTMKSVNIPLDQRILYIHLGA